MRDTFYYDTIVVGGGMAGLTAAAYTSKAGLKTLLCEMEEEVGGLVNSFDKNGFVFDAGIRAFENSGIILPMLKELGIEIEMVKNSVSVGVSNQIIKLKSKESINEYRDFLISLFPENKTDIEKIIKQIIKVMKYMDVLYGIDNPLFVDYKNDKEYLMKTLLPWLFKYSINISKAKKLNEPINDYLQKFTNNQSLIDMITQHFFKKTPSFFALSYFSLYLDYSYPIGGTGVLVKKMKAFVENNECEIITSNKILEVDYKQKVITGSNNEKYSYKKLIWAADMKSLYSCLKNSDELNNEIKSQLNIINKNKGGDSVFTLYLSLDLEKSYFADKCGPHMFYTPNKKGLSTIDINGWKNITNKEELIGWIKEYLKLTTYEISCPVLRDEKLAPMNKSGLIISTLFEYGLVEKISQDNWYQEFKSLCEAEIVKVLSETIFIGVENYILDSFSSTPLTIEKLTGNLNGAITGWSFEGDKNPSETRFQKIQNSVNTPIPYVYQAGAWTFSPSGLPISILTGKLAADEVVKKIASKKI